MALGWYLVAATAATAVLRARVWDSAACKAWLLAQPYLVAGGAVGSTPRPDATSPPWRGAGAARALTAVWVVVALNPDIASPERYSLPVRRLLGFLAAGLDASLIPVMAYLVGLFTWVLNR